MKTHAHFAGRILCGQANAKNIPLEHWIALPEKQQCRRCKKNQVAEFERRHPSARREAVRPVAYLHTMHQELGQKMKEVTLTKANPFGRPGRDYSPEYKVTTEPLYRRALTVKGEHRG